MNANQQKLKKMIREQENSIPDKEFFTSAAFQKYQTSLAQSATGRYCYGLQVLMEWNEDAEAGIAYTNSYKIHSNAANPITQSFPSRFLRALSLTGLTGHETAHHLYTDFTARILYLTNLNNGVFYPEVPEIEQLPYQKNLSEIKQLMDEKDRAGCLTLATCAATIHNILEDIYIETKMCISYPGTFKQGIQLNNMRMLELIPDLHEQIAQNYEPFSIITNLLLSYCRSGAISNRFDHDNDYMDILIDSMEYIDDALETDSVKERFHATNCLLVLLWKYISPLVEETRKKLEAQDEKSAEQALQQLLDGQISGTTPLPVGQNGTVPKNIPGSKSGKGIPSSPSSMKEAASPQARAERLSEIQTVLQEEGGRIALAKTNSILDGNNPGVTYASQYTGSGYEYAAADIMRVLNEAASEKAQMEYEQEMTEELQKAANDIHYGNAHKGIHITVHRINTVSDSLANQYDSIASPLLRTSKQLQNSILPLLKDEAEGGKQKNLLYGRRLDMHALHHTDGTYFMRTKLPNDEKRLAVGLLIDESGSMGWGNRITHARKTAIVLYDFCSSLGIPVTIYGHSTDHTGVALYSYAEFDSVDHGDRYRLMDISGRNGNRDGAALRFVAEHLVKRPENRKLLILISDGQPADCGYSGTEAEADLRGIKKEYSRQGVVLFAAAIGDDKEAIQRIYQEGFLDITNLEDLPRNLTLLVKQYLK